jgi:hydrogenase maturation protease
MPRVLVACMGNAIRGDDGFGPAVARRLAAIPRADEVDVAEFGIAGIDLVQRLMDGYDGVILVDAIDRGKPPGTVVELEPDVPDVRGLPWETLRGVLGDLHETKPARVLLMARSLGCLPPRVRILGCQPFTTDAGTELSPTVAAAVEDVVSRIGTIVRSWQGSGGEVPATEGRRG